MIRLVEVLSQATYNRNYGYNPDVISNLRLLITRLHDTIQRSKDKGDLKMQKFLEDAEAQLEKILNNLIGKYGNPSKTQDEVNYEKRYQKYYYKYPYPRTKNTKTGLSLEEEVKEQILQIMKDGESHKSQGYIDNIIPEEQMIYTLEQLSKIREEYRKRNAELEANRKAKEEKEEKALSLSMDSSKTPLLDRIRKSGKIIMKEA
jgi:hypothetical protein